jgi:membrane-associated phospholipid phosphatase
MSMKIGLPAGYLLLVSVLLVTFLGLGWYAWQVDQAGWEIGVVRWLQDSGLPGLRPVSIGLAVAGGGMPWYVLVGAIGILLFLLSGLRAVVLLLLAAILQDVGAAVKLLIERARPTEGVVDVWREVGSHSFPSGHVLGATLIVGLLFIALGRSTLDVRLKRALQGACLVWILLMGVGRMVVGAHWPTDVLGGYIVGVLLLLPIAAMLRPAAGTEAIRNA